MKALGSLIAGIALLAAPALAQDDFWQNGRAAYDVGVAKGKEVSAERELDALTAVRCAVMWENMNTLVAGGFIRKDGSDGFGPEVLDNTGANANAWTLTAYSKGATKPQFDATRKEIMPMFQGVLARNAKAAQQFFTVLGVCAVEG